MLELECQKPVQRSYWFIQIQHSIKHSLGFRQLPNEKYFLMQHNQQLWKLAWEFWSWSLDWNHFSVLYFLKLSQVNPTYKTILCLNKKPCLLFQVISWQPSLLFLCFYFFFFLIIGNWQANSVSKVDVQMPSFPLWKLFLYLQFISTLFYSTNLYCSEISQYLLGSLMSQITF